MLHESNLYSFLDEDNKFILHFFDGQKLIHDLAIINDLKGEGFAFFRDAVLMFQPMITFLKEGEGFGFYLDSKDPYFMFKIETNFTGNMRTLLLPDFFEKLPKTITGVSRLTKISGKMGENQYTSLIELNSVNLGEVANKILKDSYQVDAKIFLSEKSDQSLLLLKLPHEKAGISPQDYFKENETKMHEIFSSALNSTDEIKNAFTDIGLTFLGERPVKFKCPCSFERMIDGIKSIVSSGTDPDTLFVEGKDTFEALCDYCKTSYLISKKDIL